MAWLPDGEKILKICLFILTEFTNMTDGYIDGTPRDGIGGACKNRARTSDYGRVCLIVCQITAICSSRSCTHHASFATQKNIAHYHS